MTASPWNKYAPNANDPSPTSLDSDCSDRCYPSMHHPGTIAGSVQGTPTTAAVVPAMTAALRLSKVNRRRLPASAAATMPQPVGYTLNCDTPYASLLLDLRGGPVIIERPPRPIDLSSYSNQAHSRRHKCAGQSAHAAKTDTLPVR